MGGRIELVRCSVINATPEYSPTLQKHLAQFRWSDIGTKGDSISAAVGYSIWQYDSCQKQPCKTTYWPISAPTTHFGRRVLRRRRQKFVAEAVWLYCGVSLPRITRPMADNCACWNVPRWCPICHQRQIRWDMVDKCRQQFAPKNCWQFTPKIVDYCLPAGVSREICGPSC